MFEAAGSSAHLGKGNAPESSSKIRESTSIPSASCNAWSSADVGLQSCADRRRHLRSQHAAQERLLAHFKAEDSYDSAMHNRILRNVDGKPVFPLEGARRDGVEFALLSPQL